MINQQLLDYIKRQLGEGVSEEEIRKALLSRGWQEEEINEAFQAASGQTGRAPEPSSQEPESSLSSQPQPAASSLPGATAILGQAWAIYKRRLGTFLGITAISIIVSFAPLFLFAAGKSLNFTRLFSQLTAGSISLIVLLVLLLLVVPSLAQSWGQVALLYAVKDNREGVGILESYRRGWHKLISYWWVAILAGLVITGGFFLFIVPGIIFTTWFSLAVFVLVSENLKGMDALLKSKEYVRGRWGKVFWRLLFIFFIYFIFYLVFAFIFSLLRIPFGKDLSQITVGLFLAPLMMAYLFLLYTNLKSLRGEFVFAPRKWIKAKFIIAGIAGLIIFMMVPLIILLHSLGSARLKARNARRISDLYSIQTGLEMYYTNNGKYPSSLEELNNSSPFKYSFLDPKTGKPYQYQVQKEGEGYKICADLEGKGQKCLTF